MAAVSEKRTKKRPAASDAAPKSKKVHLDKKEKSSNDKGKKRSVPVTLPIIEDAGLSSDEGFEDEQAARESHKAQRVLHDQRRAAKPHSALLVEAKEAWALARQKNLSKEERTKHVHALMEVIRGKVRDIVFKHDASRIVQTAVKYGGQKERNEIAVELKGKYKELAQNKYSKFLVTKLVRLCPAHRQSILLEFQGSVLRLLLHREASSVLADAFELYANAYERSLLLRDFYGKEASLFSLTAGSEDEKERSKKGMKGLIEGADKERKKRVMNAVKDNLTTIFNNPDKGAVSHAIVHRALWEYLVAVNDLEDEADREKLRREIFESCQDVLAEMVHTKDGSRVVREFIAQGTAKDRKHIVKTIKPHVERMCKDDEAQLVLFTAFDIIDDTKLTAKSLVADIVSSASTLYSSPQGRRSLMYLVSPRTRRHFTPAQISLLAETDAIRAQTRKGSEVVRDPGGSLIITEIMLYAEGDKTAASETLLKALTLPYPSADFSNPHLMSLPHSSRVYKTLLQGGPFSHTDKAIVRSPSFSPVEFAKRFVRIVGQENTLAMAKDDGAFVVAVLCERAKESEDNELKDVLKTWFSGDVRKELEEDKERRGRAVLLEQLAVLSIS
ncbi:hypothetical protein EW026_g824 [Hermanssonia centrifuga]|uniref:PUM-HD domain-containing protein n=1 Tax=Hermanssonia centrifuga TaxID=98765 RepID=A0A4S4KY14_9APHY|nr:hypothetical protein EW026_g824 [Hermanssonia centrifuga]